MGRLVVSLPIVVLAVGFLPYVTGQAFTGLTPLLPLPLGNFLLDRPVYELAELLFVLYRFQLRQ